MAKRRGRSKVKDKPAMYVAVMTEASPFDVSFSGVGETLGDAYEDLAYSMETEGGDRPSAHSVLFGRFVPVAVDISEELHIEEL